MHDEHPPFADLVIQPPVGTPTSDGVHDSSTSFVSPGFCSRVCFVTPPPSKHPDGPPAKKRSPGVAVGGGDDAVMVADSPFDKLYTEVQRGVYVVGVYCGWWCVLWMTGGGVYCG